MDWFDCLNNAVMYIEEHLTDKIDYDKLGQIACCSSYHFQRMFSYVADMPLSVYIRRRKMSLAAAELQDKSVKVVDVAMKYGYSSPTAFARAFRSVHGVSPAGVKNSGAQIKSFPPIKFALTVTGAVELSYSIIKKEEFRVLGRSMPMSRDLEKNFDTVPLMWQKAMDDGTLGEIFELMDSSPSGLLGISSCGDSTEWRYFIAAASEKECDKFEEYTVPASNWAVFSGRGTNKSLQDLERHIFKEWLPASGYRYGDAPDIEVYIKPDPRDTVYEIWIPIKKGEL